MSDEAQKHIVTPGSNPAACTHTVKAGEHIGMIAARYGFADYRAIWDHPDNSSLRSLREYPFVLSPGDELHIPQQDGQTIEVQHNETHIVRLSLEETSLRVRCLDLNRDAVTRSCFFIPADGDPQMALLEGDIYSTTIDATDQTMTMEFPEEPDTPPKNDIPLVIGGLDSKDTTRGQQQRLNNLGYCAGYDDEPDKEDPQFKWAVEEFQCENGLDVDGKCGTNTQNRLVEVHGI